MGFVRSFWGVAFSLCLALSAWGGGSVQGRMEVVKVVKDDRGGEKFLQAKKAEPGEVVEYRLHYSNRGRGPVRKLVIVDPVPWGVVCDPLSASIPRQAEVEFSIDGGKSYRAWPIAPESDGSGKEVKPISPDKITHVRWIFSRELAPREEITVTYRATVK